MEVSGSRLRDNATKWEKGYGDSLQSWVRRQASLYAPTSGTSIMGAPVPPPPAAPGQARQFSGTESGQRQGDGRRVGKKRRGGQGGGGKATAAQHQVQQPPPKKFQGARQQLPEVWVTVNGVDVNVNAQRGDGRFLFSNEGVELCYSYNRNQGGCTDVCSAQPHREHLCER